MKKTGLFVLGAFFLINMMDLKLAFSSQEELKELIESFEEKSRINWTTGVIRATGVGLPPASASSKAQAKLSAQRAAKVDAYRRLAEIVEGVRVSSETNVLNYILQDTNVSTRVKGFIKGARETEIRYYADGACEVTIEASLNGKGGLSDIILPQVSEPKITEVSEPLVKEEEIKLAETADTATAQGESLTQLAQGPQGQEAEGAAAFSGLVIDAKGLGVQPALSPKVLTEQKEEVYGVAYADPIYRSENGLVEYRTDVEQAKTSRRVTQTPYVIKGVQVAGNNKSDIIIRTADAQMFQNSEGNEEIVKRCRVVIVLE